MKKALLIMSIVAAVAMTGCDNRENIQGSWQSDPVKIDMPNTATSSATYVMTFDQGGKASINASIIITEPMATVPGDSITPYQVSISATASVDGTWQYAKGENDEVLITLDDSTLNVNVDPEAVTFALNSATDTQSPQIQALKGATVAKYTAMLSNEMRACFGKFSKIEDIHSDGKVLTFEVDNHGTPDQHFVFKAM